jgi:hypothetical protein
MQMLGEHDAPFAERFARLLGGHGPSCELDASSERVRLAEWRLVDPATAHPVVFEGWNALWEGLAAMEDRRLVVLRRLDLGDPVFEWGLRESTTTAGSA